jgi:hypothetical protein
MEKITASCLSVVQASMNEQRVDHPQVDEDDVDSDG